MDYPTQDSNARLSNGKFTDGNPIDATPPSKNSANYQNAVYDELLNVISGGDLVPDETAFDQVFTAIGNIAKGIVSSQTAGQISNFPGTAVPDGWLKANGQTVSRAAFPYLWAYAQNSGNLAASDGVKTDGQFGPGDDAITFTLPDLRGVHLRNWDDGKSIDTGRVIGSNQDDDNKQHSHSASTVSAGNHSHSASTVSAGNHNHTASSNAAGGHNHTFNVLQKGTGTSNILTGSETLAGGMDQTRTNETKSTSSQLNHTHVITVNNDGDHSHGVTVNNDGDHSHGVTVNNSGGTEVRVKNIAVMVCIKY